MTTKLTLTIDDTVINSAKKYAKRNGKSLSNLVENYLKSVGHTENTVADISPKVSRLLGIVKLPDGFDYKKELGKSLLVKYKK